MKLIPALILTALLLCTVLAPCVFAAEEPAVSAEIKTEDIVTASGSVTDAYGSIDTATPSDAGTVTLTSFNEPDRTDAVAFAVGTTQEALADWFSSSVTGFSGYDVEGNYYDLISGDWDLDAVNTGSAGVYYAWTSPDLGTEYTLADGFSLPRQLCAVSIQVPGEPDINCFVAGRGFLHFPWILSAMQEEQLDTFAVWLRLNDGEWTSLSNGFLFLSDGLQLSQRVLTYGSTYDLKVTYPGGQTGVLTFQYDGELSIIDYSGGDRDGGDVNGVGSGTGTQPAPTPTPTPTQPPGNSDGADSQNSGNDTPAPNESSSEADDTSQNSGSTSGEPQNPQEGQDSSSDGTQTTPTAPQSPSDSQNNGNHNSDGNSQAQVPVAESTSTEQEKDTVPKPKDSAQAVMNPVSDDYNTQFEKSSTSQESAAVTESYSPTQTTISGLRLKDLCNEEERVVFGSGDLTVSIPSKLLLSLNLSDTDTLTVRLTQPESNQIALAVEVSGKSVTLLSGTVLRLRYIPQSKNTDITVQGGAGEQITEISCDETHLRFTVDTAGTYTIKEQFSTPKTRKSTSLLLPISGGLILAAGGITFFRRKRHG